MGTVEASQHIEAGSDPGSGPVFGRRAGDSESLGAFDPGMSPAAFENLLAACGLGVGVLTADQALAEVLRQTSGGHPTVQMVEDWASLCAVLDTGQCDIVLLDMDSAGDKLGKWLTELERRPAPPLVVAASSFNDAPELMRALTARRIHRLLLKPATPGKARLLIGAAINRCLQRNVDPAERSPRKGQAGPQWFGQPRGRVVGLAAALVAGVAIIFGLFSVTPRGTALVEEPPPVTRPVERAVATPEPAAPADPAAEALARADRAFAAGWLVEPPEDNALDGYAAILAEHPDHAAAREGLEATITLLFTWAESSLLGGVPELAASTLDHVRRMRPDSTRLAFLDAQLERALAVEAEARAEEEARVQAAATQAAAPRPIDRLLGVSRQRLQRGQLAQPSGDSALAYFHQAAAIDAADRGVVQMRATLGTALVELAQQRLDEGQIALVEPLISEARQLGADPAVLAGLDARLAEVRAALRQEREASLLMLGLERLRDGQLIAPESDSAAYYLTSLRAEAPDHPELQEPWRWLGESLVARIREAAAGSDWGEAEVLLAGLQGLGTEAGVVEALAGELAVARLQEELLTTLASADELTLVRARQPVYPEIALRNNLEGWVELEFIVDRTGRPRDITVVGAEPPGSFERAATYAVSRYVYEPFTVDGVVYERRVGLMVRFTLQ